ncbi:site-specific DNA-methyltransferase [Leptothrix discophora]|uniref:site-specific DNA-methyltransferase (adenine-specific) n=1 Tax=Leptothrix discophora TaxID=89 RepID=A0ABT9G073_LEPDI|nr:site-specific DNA-methyltransferase [Leptothrix discophora]MDP4299702.1 site-specific DNA-methyltransferase [Leptothrix discophora]
MQSEIDRLAELIGIPTTNLGKRSAALSFPDFGELNARLICADNLVALECLGQTESPRFDFCYIDPPYNTGQRFIYDDNRTSSARGIWGAHTNWMAFMLPRLLLAKKVMSDTGIIAVSIDDYEHHRLRVLMDAVFDEANHVGTLVVGRSKNGKGSQPGISVNHEYVLIFRRSDKATLRGLSESNPEGYDKSDSHGSYKIDGLFRKKGDASRRVDRPNMFFPLYYDDDGNVSTVKSGSTLKEVFPVDSSGIERRWLWGPEKTAKESWKLYASKSGVVYVKNYLTANKRVKIRSIWDNVGYLTEKATLEVKEIYGEKVFETPKPLTLIEHLVECCVDERGLVLDFFAGTGTTAHATENVNAADGGLRRVVLVEQNVPTPGTHIARTMGFGSLSDLTRHRLQYIQKQRPDYQFDVLDWTAETAMGSA